MPIFYQTMRTDVLLLLFVILTVSGCSKAELPNDMPSDFQIFYSFGVGEGNVLDTKNNLYEKDMVSQPDKNYTFILSNSEKKEIYDVIILNDLFDLKDEFTKNCDIRGCINVQPESGLTLKVTIEGKSKTIKWRSSYIDGKDSEIKRLFNVTGTINTIIQNKEKEMNIEQPKDGYL
jgi:hypothetical protein